MDFTTLISQFFTMLFGWLPRRRVVLPVQTEVVFVFPFFGTPKIRTYHNRSYWHVPWMTRIKTFTVVSDPGNYDPIVFTSTDGTTWSIDVAVTWLLTNPVLAATTTDDANLMCNIKSDASLVSFFLNKNDEQIKQSIHSRIAAQSIKRDLDRSISRFGFRVEIVDVQAFHRIRCFKHQGISQTSVVEE